MLKTIIRHALEKAGYEVGRKRKHLVSDARFGINVLELVAARLAASQPDLTLLQVGANDGQEEDPIRPLLERYGLRAFLCEPLPDAFAKLQANYRHLLSVTPLRVAIGPTTGTVPIYRLEPGSTKFNDAFNDTLIASLDRSHVEHFAQIFEAPAVTTEYVRCVTVKDLMFEYGIDTIEIAAIDAEGYDHIICNELLNLTNPPNIIHFEYASSPREDVLALMERLTSLGYIFARSGLDITAVRE